MKTKKPLISVRISEDCVQRMEELSGSLNLTKAELSRGLLEAGLLQLLGKVELNPDLAKQSEAVIASLRRGAMIRNPQNPLLR